MQADTERRTRFPRCSQRQQTHTTYTRTRTHAYTHTHTLTPTQTQHIPTHNTHTHTHTHTYTESLAETPAQTRRDGLVQPWSRSLFSRYQPATRQLTTLFQRQGKAASFSTCVRKGLQSPGDVYFVVLGEDEECRRSGNTATSATCHNRSKNPSCTERSCSANIAAVATDISEFETSGAEHPRC